MTEQYGQAFGMGYCPGRVFRNGWRGGFEGKSQYTAVFWEVCLSKCYTQNIKFLYFAIFLHTAYHSTRAHLYLSAYINMLMVYSCYGNGS